MKTQLASRPNLDHLRRQAKSLLAALAAGDDKAVATFRQHLPAAKKLSPAQVLAAGFRLADAQSAIARQSGFEAWPKLARHVEQLRSMEGTWSFARLEIDGSEIPAAAMTASRLLIDGDRFRMESPEATYEGVFNIDVEAEPHQIDIEFVVGPEAGKLNRGIFTLEGDEFKLCLDMSGKGRPTEFRTRPGSNHACETLRRSSPSRPEAVDGGKPAAGNGDKPSPAGTKGFDHVRSATLDRLGGAWSAVKIVRDGVELPSHLLKVAHREARRNEVKITIGGSVVVHALVRIDEKSTPMTVDYQNIGGPAAGTTQQGIMEWRGADACFCMAAPGQPRPKDFDSPAGGGRTLSVWRVKP